MKASSQVRTSASPRVRTPFFYYFFCILFHSFFLSFFEKVWPPSPWSCANGFLQIGRNCDNIILVIWKMHMDQVVKQLFQVLASVFVLVGGCHFLAYLRPCMHNAFRIFGGSAASILFFKSSTSLFPSFFPFFLGVNLLEAARLLKLAFLSFCPALLDLPFPFPPPVVLL